MGVVVYRKGGTHVVDGIKCEQTIIDPNSLPGHLAGEWVIDPKELYLDYVAPDVTEGTDGEVAGTGEDTGDGDGDGGEEDKPPTESELVRAAAKDAGIEGWDTKRIKTLRKALGTQGDDA